MSSAIAGERAYANVSRQSVKSYHRRPRPQCSDEVCISSPSILYLGCQDHILRQNTLHYHTGNVSLRLTIYIGDSRESQEVTSFLDKEENSSDSDTDHHYEMLEDVVNPNNTCADNSPFDDFDSFDSDDSVEAFGNPEKEICNGRLPAPPPPQNIYGITKIAEVAGRKMLKLRKSFGRMRTSKRHLHLTASPTASQGIKPSPPLPPPPLEKANSAGTIATPNRYFSLRKFKKSVSSPTQISSKETSTFYLSNDSSSEHNSSFRNADDDLIVTSSSTQTLVSENSTSPSLNLSNGDRNRKTTPDRRASAPARPNSPPPLPPTDASKKLNKKEKKNSSTSWYAECGLFDRRVSLNFEASKKATNKEITPNCWYAEVGLWDGRSSPNESSLSEQDNSQVTDASEYSTSQENSGILTYFKDEPLYQFYNATVVELAQKEMQGELDSDGYEEIGADGMLKLKSRPTAMELIQPRDGLQRTLWCEIPEVVNSRVLSTLNIHQKKLQEAKFEIITSEASYVNSLNVLQNHFISSPEFCDMSILSKNDKRILFGNVLPVKICSEKFLAELEECWQDNILLHGICDVIYKHATQNFNVYIKYCSNQIYLDRTLRRLRDQYDTFSEVLQRLESSPECQALSLHSFLMLPMQRITRLPLLVDAMLSRLHPEDDEYKICELALAALNKVVQDCNEGARRMERMEEILILSRQLEFPKEIKPIPIISSTRWLVRCGEVTQLLCRGEDVRLTFGKRFSKMTLHLYLFTDLLVITKKKSDECFIVLDYCPRNLVQMASADSVPHLPVRAASDGGKNLIMLTMLQNHENKTTEMFLSCSLESDRQRWLEAVMPPSSDNPEESVYEQWDCPQVQTLHPYSGQQPDELSLAMSDVVNVLRKVPDGWYYGERIRDGEKGWFPGNHTVEIASAHVRAKNLKQRYRLLTLSGTFLESQRKQGK